MPRFISRARSILALCLAPALSITACGSDATTGPAPTIEATTFASSLNVNLAASTKVNGMYYRDLVVGTGAAVSTGQTVSAHYTGWLSNGTQFDNNGPTDTPLPFRLGLGDVIPGWDVGLAGIKVGGQRQLIIPPDLAYGSRGYLSIPGNAILVFNVTVVSAK